ncbi:Down syndrome cell adhesion molecule-like [Exaiptasia diaphana]|nr:Down syndrome cell adhesion molecule-like [Exaiptasia diaphana]
MVAIPKESYSSFLLFAILNIILLWTATAGETTVPEGRPSRVFARSMSSTSIEVTWTLPASAKFNGPRSGFRITYTTAGEKPEIKQVGNTARTALLNKLKKWTKYSIMVSLSNSKHVARESTSATATTLSDVPDIAPQGIEVTEQNKTTFIIAWQPLPRNKVNGKITMYKIVWALRHIGRAKRMAVGDTFTGTTKGTQFVLLGLRLCAQYEVHVAAATVAGLGPNATQGVTTSRPGEPHNLKPRRIGKSFITLAWEKPKGVIEDETDYMVYFKGSKPYWPEYGSPLKSEKQDGKQTTLKIDNLQPGTYYEFWVTALTVCGESNRSLTETVETKVDMSSPKVTINPDETTLPSSKGSSQTLTCTVIAASPSDIQWFRNSTMKIESATNGSLVVKFISAQDIISTYKCTRKDPKSRSVICTMSYTCRVTLVVKENTEPAEATAKVTVNLNVPAKQDFKFYRYGKGLWLDWLRWRPKQSDDMGRITGYKIKLNGNVFNVKPSKTQHTLPGLQAYTLYRVQMKAISVVGEGLWSDVKEVTTLVSVILYLEALWPQNSQNFVPQISNESVS